MIFVVNQIVILFEIILFKNMKHERKNLFLILTFIQLFLLLGLRSEYVGIDTPVYHLDIGYILNGYSVGFEIGNNYLIKLLYNCFGNAQAVFLGYAFLTLVGVYYYIINLSKDVYFSVLMYESFLYYNFAFSGIRQALAISSTLIAVVFLIKNRTFLGLLFIGLACLFHTSSLIVIIYYFIIHGKIKLNNRSLLLFLSFVFLLFLFIAEPLIEFMVSIFDTYSWYLDSYEMGTSSYVNLVFYLIVLLICFYYCVVNKKNENMKTETKILFPSLAVGEVLYFMAIQFRLVNRLTLYFTFPMILLIPNFISGIHRQKTRLCFQILIAVISSMYLFMLIYTNSNGIVPYKFFWQIRS